MKVKTNELSGAALDWAVAKCEGPDTADISEGGSYMVVPGAIYWNEEGEGFPIEYSPSTNWAQGGPIIEREKIGFKYTGAALDFVAWVNGQLSTKHDKYGPTPLIAAMRCYVTSKLGDEVEIPEELK